MSADIKLRKGLNIKLKGKAEKLLETAPTPETYAIKPTDFPGLTPKLSVKVGQSIKVGEPLFFDKYNPEIFITTPVGGNIISINRGERRKILEVVIQPDENAGYVEFKKADPLTLSSEEIKEQLQKSGLWPFIKRRPYGIIAKPNETPKAIFISMFDTAPLAPNFDFILNGQESTFQTGLNALSKLTSGKIRLGINADSETKTFQNAEINRFSGPHPAGNVGIHIHHISPINKGDIIWTINPQDVLFIGRLFETGKLDMSKIVALTGSEVEHPLYLKTKVGTKISSLVDGNLKNEKNQRIISGNVLTGTKISSDSYLGFYDSEVTVIPEGDEYEFMGWALPGIDKFSASKTFMSSFLPKKEYELNANLHGGERAFVMSGQYEKLVPMDILPVHLLKAIIVNDIDKMETLGIYEIIEEDFALCEYACTSKIKVQDIIRQGINTMIKELG
jgi:Na+-transporting NADH:ubiquinone oxidoreductase subunit A